MIKRVLLRITPEAAANDTALEQVITVQTNITLAEIKGFTIIKKSIDARSKNIWVNLTIDVYISETPPDTSLQHFHFEKLSKNAKTVLIIGTGPAGIFAALQLIQLGIKPILIDRGKEVRSRRRDLAILNKEGILNTESNYCFGEGGAGTYSDGKLYTRSNKRGNVQRILDLFVKFGADTKINYEAHPHIGTNKLPQIITAMRQCIEACGGEFHFEKKMVDFSIELHKIKNIRTANGDILRADAYILATGHSARDIYYLLHKKNILIESKPFALGVRVEHPQALIDLAQYKCAERGPFLPPASYSLVEQVNGKGVFSFCMCPGGIIATASTGLDELVVNGWSPSKRNNIFANSGIVVEVQTKDLQQLKKTDPGYIMDNNILDPLNMMQFQQAVEKKAFLAGGGKFVAPAQRMIDFAEKKISTDLPRCSYLPGIQTADLREVLPDFVYSRLATGFKTFGKKLKNYYSNEAVIVATESRTSSPVKIPRDPEKLTHPQLSNLYPCGEGAGYAGGIVSAAMDGEKCALQISKII